MNKTITGVVASLMMLSSVAKADTKFCDNFGDIGFTVVKHKNRGIGIEQILPVIKSNVIPELYSLVEGMVKLEYMLPFTVTPTQARQDWIKGCMKSGWGTIK